MVMSYFNVYVNDLQWSSSVWASASLDHGRPIGTWHRLSQSSRM